eukprot:7452-Heterococcus_DN1.PRE.1
MVLQIDQLIAAAAAKEKRRSLGRSGSKHTRISAITSVTAAAVTKRTVTERSSSPLPPSSRHKHAHTTLMQPKMLNGDSNSVDDTTQQQQQQQQHQQQPLSLRAAMTMARNSAKLDVIVRDGKLIRRER